MVLCSNIAMYSYDLEALSYVPAVKSWKRFRDVVFVLWEHSRDDLDKFFNFMNFIDSSKTRQFTISCPTDNVLEFFDLTLSFDAASKQISVDVFIKPTNSFTYVMPSTCFPRRNIEKVPEDVGLRLRRICDTGSKFKVISDEYQQYLIARGYKPHKVTKQFSDVAKISREIARQPSVKMDLSNFIFNQV